MMQILHTSRKKLKILNPLFKRKNVLIKTSFYIEMTLMDLFHGLYKPLLPATVISFIFVLLGIAK